MAMNCEGEHDGAEPDVDGEPSLGSVSNYLDQRSWSIGGTDDAEGDEHDGREPDDSEPSLGWTADGAFGDSGDREEDGSTVKFR